MANPQTTEIVRPEETLKRALDKAKGSFSAVAARHITPERLMKVALGAATRNPLLLQCTPSSIVRSVLQGAELGLEPGSALNHAYLVPFKNKKVSPAIWEAQLIVGYMGLAELAYRSGLVSFITSEVVYEDDHFEYELGLDPKLKHLPESDEIDSSKITHAYMVVGLKDGGKVFKVMNRAAIDRIRARSQAGSSDYSPWATDYAEMAKKTVIKNGMKLVPKSIEMARALRLDDAVESGDMSLLEFDIPESTMELPANTEEPRRGIQAVKDKAVQKGAVSQEDAFANGATVLRNLMTEKESRDLQAVCQSQGRAEDAVLDAASKAGVTTVPALFEFIENMQEGLPL